MVFQSALQVRRTSNGILTPVKIYINRPTLDKGGGLRKKLLKSWFMRWITNCVEDPPCGHAAFLHYWSRRLVVAFMAAQIRLLLARQKERDPCFSYVSEAALHLDNCNA